MKYSFGKKIMDSDSPLVLDGLDLANDDFRLDKEDLYSVEWLPADVSLIEKIVIKL